MSDGTGALVSSRDIPVPSDDDDDLVAPDAQSGFVQEAASPECMLNLLNTVEDVFVSKGAAMHALLKNLTPAATRQARQRDSYPLPLV